MTRRMSCSMTIEAVRTRTKRVTRRHEDTWKDLQPGDRLTLIEKGMGLPKGAHQVVLAEVEIVSNDVEMLDRVNESECELEGFPELSPAEFRAFWCRGHGFGSVHPERQRWIWCRRIEWRYLDDPVAS